MTRKELLQVAKPILFNTDMVRAILDGRKTVTRRLVKPQQVIGLGCDKCPNNMPQEYIKQKEMLFKPWCDMSDNELISAIYKPPYESGDILYVRETWCKNPNYEEYYFKTRPHGIEPYNLKWKPSIHMPKEAARIFLRVTDVRVERLQECGKGWCLEIEKEGVVTPQAPILYVSDDEFHEALREEFQKLWDSTIKKEDIDKYGWGANPWVWVIEFERIEVEV